MKALVLCGGNSNRMGKDKGLISSGTKIWAQLQAEKLEDLGLDTFVSINTHQKKYYINHFSEKQLIVDRFYEEITGPFIGILSAYQLFPEEDWLVIPCDLQDLNKELLSSMVNAIKEDSTGHDIYLFKTEDIIQSLCGVYTRKSLDKLSKMEQNQELKNISMKSISGMVSVRFFPLDPDSQKLFKNYNTPEDLRSPSL